MSPIITNFSANSVNLNNKQQNKANKPAFGATQAEIKELINAYKANGDKYEARFLEYKNNSRKRFLSYKFDLEILPVGELKEWAKEVVKRLNHVMPLHEKHLAADAKLLDETKIPAEKQKIVDDFRQIYLPKIYKGTTEQTEKILKKAASDPVARERMVLNRNFIGQLGYYG